MQVWLLYCCQATLITVAILVTRPPAVLTICVVGCPQLLHSNADRSAVRVVESREHGGERSSWSLGTSTATRLQRWNIVCACGFVVSLAVSVVTRDYTATVWDVHGDRWSTSDCPLTSLASPRPGTRSVCRVAIYIYICVCPRSSFARVAVLHPVERGTETDINTAAVSDVK